MFKAEHQSSKSSNLSLVGFSTATTKFVAKSALAVKFPLPPQIGQRAKCKPAF
jgi:hypothetical protein